MSQYAIKCEQVWKKFSRGERADSIRDAIPAMVRLLLNRQLQGLKNKQFWALKDVSFTVASGEVLGIIGPNGAGKSTLLKILSSIMVPNQGRISIRGKLTALIEVGAGFHPDLTGRENIYLNGAILGMARREIRSKIDDIMDFAGVRDFIDTPVKRYSSGMQARLGFSVASHMEPDVLLVDEVLAVGDALFQQKCLERMHDFANSGRAIIFISHNLQAISELCPNTLLLMSGERVFLGSTSQAIQKYFSNMREVEIQPMHGPVSIHRVRLSNSAGEESAHFNANDKARLSFDLKIDHPASQYSLTFAIRRATDSLVVSDYNLLSPSFPISRSLQII